AGRAAAPAPRRPPPAGLGRGLGQHGGQPRLVTGLRVKVQLRRHTGQTLVRCGLVGRRVRGGRLFGEDLARTSHRPTLGVTPSPQFPAPRLVGLLTTSFRLPVGVRLMVGHNGSIPPMFDSHDPNFLLSDAQAVPEPHQCGSRASKVALTSLAIARRRLSRVMKCGYTSRSATGTPTSTSSTRAVNGSTHA